MFSVSAFKLIRRNCPEDFDKLLKLLAVDNPNWELDDEFKLAQELDRKIDKKLCALLDSDSDIDGYAKLLECGEVEFSFSETRKDLLKKILLNRDRILRDSSDYTQSPKIKITCNRAESAFDVKNKSFLDNIQASVKEFCSALKDGDIKRLIPQKEEISLKSSAQQAIRNILAKEYDLNNCEEISISIIEKNLRRRERLFRALNWTLRLSRYLSRLIKFSTRYELNEVDKFCLQFLLSSSCVVIARKIWISS